jgi:adenosylhomocysteinase
MKYGAIVCNNGYFNSKIDLKVLKKMSKSVKILRDFVDEYTLRNSKTLYMLGEVRLINLAADERHLASVVDMSFANQAFSVWYFG